MTESRESSSAFANGKLTAKPLNPAPLAAREKPQEETGTEIPVESITVEPTALEWQPPVAS